MKNQQFVPQPPLVGVEPNPGPRRSPRLSEEKRWRVIHLATELHLGPVAIAKRVGAHRDTVADLLKKYHDTGTVKDRPGRGRKRKLSAEDEKKIVKKAKHDKDARQIAREYESETGTKIDETTIRRVIHAHKLKWLVREHVEELTETNKAKRLAYAQAMSEHNWKKVLFSDEKTFWLGADKNHAWQTPGKRQQYPMKRHPPKIHVWAAAGTYMKSKLYFFTENLKSPLYQKILASRLAKDKITFSSDSPVRLPNNFEFLQDNDPKHKAKKTMELLQEIVNNRRIDHPAQSPDLNIMEDLWSYLDRKVKAANIKTIQGLKRKITSEWEKLPWSYIRNSVGTMPARLAECVKLEGARTHY